MTVSELIQLLAEKYPYSVRFGSDSMCMSQVAATQREGGICAYIDLLFTVDPGAAEASGVNIGTLYLAQPQTMELACDIAESILASGAIDTLAIVGGMSAVFTKRK